MAEVVKGLRDTLKKLNALEKDLSVIIEDIVESNAKDASLNAKQLARNKGVFDNGDLVQNIGFYKVEQDKGEITYAIAANIYGEAPYSAYHEFGTGGLVNIPAEMADEAAKFRGKGIRQVNIRPRPYLYPAFLQQRVKYLQDLEDLLDQETKKI